MFKLDLEKAEEPEIKLPTFTVFEKAREFQKIIYFCFIDYAKAFDYVDLHKLWKFWKKWEFQTTWPPSWETYIAGQEETELDMEQQTGSKLGKEYVKAGPEMLSWMKHKLESRLPGEISITSDMQMTPPSWQKVKKN